MALYPCRTCFAQTPSCLNFTPSSLGISQSRAGNTRFNSDKEPHFVSSHLLRCVHAGDRNKVLLLKLKAEILQNALWKETCWVPSSLSFKQVENLAILEEEEDPHYWLKLLLTGSSCSLLRLILHLLGILSNLLSERGLSEGWWQKHLRTKRKQTDLCISIWLHPFLKSSPCAQHSEGSLLQSMTWNSEWSWNLLAK